MAENQVSCYQRVVTESERKHAIGVLQEHLDALRRWREQPSDDLRTAINKGRSSVRKLLKPIGKGSRVQISLPPMLGGGTMSVDVLDNALRTVHRIHMLPHAVDLIEEAIGFYEAGYSTIGSHAHNDALPSHSALQDLENLASEASALSDHIRSTIIPSAYAVTHLSPNELMQDAMGRPIAARTRADQLLQAAERKFTRYKDELSFILEKHFEPRVLAHIRLLFSSTVPATLIGDEEFSVRELEREVISFHDSIQSAIRRIRDPDWQSRQAVAPDGGRDRKKEHAIHGSEVLKGWQADLVTSYSGIWGAKVLWLALFTIAPTLVSLKVERLGLSLAPAHLVYVLYHVCGALLWFNVRHLQDKKIPWTPSRRTATWRRCKHLRIPAKILGWITFVLFSLTILGKARVEFADEEAGLVLPVDLYHVLGVDPEYQRVHTNSSIPIDIRIRD